MVADPVPTGSGWFGRIRLASSFQNKVGSGSDVEKMLDPDPIFKLRSDLKSLLHQIFLSVYISVTWTLFRKKIVNSEDQN